MRLLNIICRMALREISGRTGLSRKTIAKYLNAGKIEPAFTIPERPNKLDPFANDAITRDRFFNVVDLVNRSEMEMRNGKQGRIADLTRLEFIILD